MQILHHPEQLLFSSFVLYLQARLERDGASCFGGIETQLNASPFERKPARTTELRPLPPLHVCYCHQATSNYFYIPLDHVTSIKSVNTERQKVQSEMRATSYVLVRMRRVGLQVQLPTTGDEVQHLICLLEDASTLQPQT